MDSIKNALVQTYNEKSGIDAEKIAQLMDDETWFIAKDALKQGFCTSLSEKPADPKAVKNALDMNLSQFGFAHTPNFQNMLQEVKNTMLQDNATPTSPMIDAKKLEDITARLDQLEQTNKALKAESDAESRRKNDIESLFAIFTTRLDMPYQAHYQKMRADCLSDPSITLEKARLMVKDFRAGLSEVQSVSADMKSPEPDMKSSEPKAETITFEAFKEMMTKAHGTDNSEDEDKELKRLQEEYPDYFAQYSTELDRLQDHSRKGHAKS